MFHPSVLDRKEREYQQYMDTQTPIAAQKIRNFVNGNNNHSLSQALPNEVLYDQNYVNQIANELERVKLQLLLTQRELNLKNNQLNDAYLNISKGNATLFFISINAVNLVISLYYPYSMIGNFLIVVSMAHCLF